MASVGDDRLSHAIPFILDHLDHYRRGFVDITVPPPLILGLNGIQGCGKSTVVERLQETLSASPHSLHIVVFSIDDLYLPHDDQLALARSHSDNPLVQHRGQPSTHDVQLGKKILESLRANQDTDIPIYDKSAFGGQGDRVRDRVVTVSAEKRKIDLVILEGWFTGFRALPAEDVRNKWRVAKEAASSDPATYMGRLGHNKLDHIAFINEELKKYDVLTDQFDALIHIDAEDNHYVYDWRLEAEEKLRDRTGSGMTDEEVKTFVDGYYPSYEIYTDQLRSGAFPKEQGKQLRLVVGKDRKVKQAIRI